MQRDSNFGRLLSKSDVDNASGKWQFRRQKGAEMMDALSPLCDFAMQMRIKLMNMALANSYGNSRDKKNAKFVLRGNSDERPQAKSRRAATRST